MRGTGEHFVERLRSIVRSGSAIILVADGDVRLNPCPDLANDAAQESPMSRGLVQAWTTRLLLCLFVFASTGCSLLLDLEDGKVCEEHTDCEDNRYCTDLLRWRPQ